MQYVQQVCKVSCFSTIYTIFFALVITSLTAHAGQKEQAIVAKMINAYGGDKLTKAKQLRVLGQNKVLYTGQGIDPNFTEINKQNTDLVIDFENQRKSLITYDSSGRGIRLTKVIFDGKHGRMYDLLNNTFNNNDYFNFSTVGASIERAHDTLLARVAWENKEKAEFLGEIVHRTIPHQLLKVIQPNGPDLILHINQQTGLISRMTRSIQHLGEIAYVFSNHKVIDGVTFAADYQLNVAGQPEVFSMSRDIELNPSIESAFGVPANTQERGESIDSSKMNVQTLATGVYFVGQGHRFSVFSDVGDYFIAVGGNSGLKARYQAVIKEVGVDKPLKYQVVTHHHSDHLEGMADAAELGAKFITVEAHVSSIQNSLKEKLAKDRFVLVKENAQFANGTVKVYEMASSHSDQNLLVYVPKAKAMFVADHFSSDLKTDLPNADKGTLTLRKKINQLQLDVSYFLGAHGSRVLTMSDLEKVTDSYIEGKCPAHMAVCGS